MNTSEVCVCCMMMMMMMMIAVVCDVPSLGSTRQHEYKIVSSDGKWRVS